MELVELQYASLVTNIYVHTNKFEWKIAANYHHPPLTSASALATAPYLTRPETLAT